MTIWLYSLFGSEEQLMPYFLRHYAPEVDRLVMLDGGSTDGSRTIIGACPKAEIRESPFVHGGYDEYACTAYLAEQAATARGKADWALVVDADEFLYSPLGLRAALDSYRAAGMRAVKATGYQMTADKFPATDGQLTDLVRSGVPDPEYDKLASFDPACGVIWSPGRHNYRCSATVYQPGMKLLHYRYFGADWLRERNAQNYARRGVLDINANRGFHCAPDHTGKYSLAWWQAAAQLAKEVIP